MNFLQKWGSNRNADKPRVTMNVITDGRDMSTSIISPVGGNTLPPSVSRSRRWFQWNDKTEITLLMLKKDRKIGTIFYQQFYLHTVTLQTNVSWCMDAQWGREMQYGLMRLMILKFAILINIFKISRGCSSQHYFRLPSRGQKR